MRVCAFAAVLLSAVLALHAEDEPLPVWPAPGARFPADPKPLPVPDDRSGAAVWANPPAVMSPYRADWYDYASIVWGGENRLQDPAKFHAALRQMFVTGGLVYSQHSPKGHFDTQMPFYCTNLCNNLYLRNKTGGTALKGFKGNRGKEHLVRKPSLEDPANDASECASAAKVAERCASGLPLAYDLRDEATYTNSSASPFDYDFSPLSLACFRQWLRAKYGSLEKLNASWGTTYKAWDEATPKTSDELQAELQKGLANLNLAPWADHREYNDDTMQAAVARYADAIRKIDPRGPVGYSGTQMPSAWGGFDYWKMGHTINWIEHYECNGSRELIRSFMHPSAPKIAAIRYDSADQGIARMWYLVLHGDSGGLIWPFQGNNTSSMVLFDVHENTATLTEKGRNLRAIFREAREGIPCLLRHAEARTEPIGVLHSQASIRADWPLEVLRDGDTWINRFSSYEGGHNFAAFGREGIYKMLEDLGCQYTCVSSRQVETGALLAKGCKLFFVPRGMALSDAEIAGLKAFVEGGGVLVTDLMAGRMNENGSLRAASPIDELLGLKRGAFDFEQEKKAENEKGGGYAGGFGRALKVTLESDFGTFKKGGTLDVQGYQEPGLAAGDAKALATTPTGPALLERALGKGFAYTLNFDIPNYLALRSSEKSEGATAQLRQLFAAFLEKAGVAPAVKVSAKGGGGQPVCLENFRFTQGAAEYVALHANGNVQIETDDLSDQGQGATVKAGAPLTIALPKKGFVYEMRTGKAFGQTDRVELAMAKDRPLVFSILPYEVTGLKAELGEGKIVDGKLALEVSIVAEGDLGDHVVHAELLDEKKEAIPESVVNLPLVKGVYKGAIDCSFVPGEGPWTLRLRDVASGKSLDRAVSK
ncbi:MAG: beta-galactosidase [Planctomycetota bacterium]|nr:beta-galactosidase [Planctomycetota bacterium]